MATPTIDRPGVTDVGTTATDMPPSYGTGGFFGHPKGLSTLFFTEMWERFSYYGLRPLLILFMSAAIARGGYGFDRSEAASIVGIYAASVYLASLPGGWIADRWLGLQRGIWWGGVLIALGHLAIALSAVFAQQVFFLGLILIVIGTGLLKQNISAMVGDLYPEGGARRDAGFSIFYMGINVGALVAPLVTGFLGERVGWHWGFGAAGVGMVIGLITYRMRTADTLGPIGVLPSTTDPREQATVRNWALGIAGAIILLALLTMSGVVHIDAVWLAKRMGAVMALMAIVYFAYILLLGGLTGDEKRRVIVIITLFAFAIVFWAAFEQAPTSLNLFAKDFTDRRIFGWKMPALWLQAANSVFVIALAPVFGALWVTLARRGMDISSPAKFAFGLFAAGLGFLLMVPAANMVLGAGGNLLVSPWWLIGSYLLQTFGELSLSPVGLSSMTKLAPRKFTGQMMGVWFMATALGNLIAGLVGGQVDPNKLDQMPMLFRVTALALFGASVLCALLIIPIRRMMTGVDQQGARS